MNNSNVIAPFNIGEFKYKKNYALEASAGTGKTYSITEIVKKLVYEHRLGLNKILIVTYTEKAAGELKNRIREALTEPQKALGGKSIKEVVGDEVNCDVDNASIGTIHSFCQSTIKEFPLSSDQPLQLDLASDLSIIKFASGFIREGAILKDITSLLGFNIEINDSTLVTKFCAVMNSYYLNNLYDEEPSIISYKENMDIVSGFEMLLSDEPITILQRKLPDLYGNYLTLKNSSHPNSQRFVNLFENFHAFFVDEQKKSDFKMTKTKGNEVPEADISAFSKLFAFFKNADSFKKHPNYFLVFKYIKDFYRKYQEYKLRNKLQTFNDMIRMVRESVLDDNSKLLKCLRDKYTYAIIDEFQDTNQIQFDIFSRVFMGDKNHNIIVVGDPKQSIYSFQGADVSVYQKAVDLIAQTGEKCRLEKNYRSSPGVVEFGNALFKEYLFDNEFTKSLYCTYDPNEKEEKRTKERRLVYKGEYCASLWTNRDCTTAEGFAKFVVEQILDCISKDKDGHTNLRKLVIEKDGKENYEDVDFSDFVVLAKARSEMMSVKRALKNAGIPYLMYKDNSLFFGKECAHWLAILEAINVPDFTGYNRGYYKKALFTKFFDLSLGEISKDKYNEDDSPQIELLKKWRIMSHQKLWQDLFDTIMIDSHLEEHLSSLSDLQSLAAFKQIANYAIDYLSNNHEIDDLIKHLRDIISVGETDDDDSSLVAKSTEFECVRLMTMHASKGLQFPVVISSSGITKPKTSSDVYSYHEKDSTGKKGQHILSISKPKDLWDDENYEELYRLFYVAYTRSEYLLVVPNYTEDMMGQITNIMRNFLEEYKDKTFTQGGKQVPFFEYKDLQGLSYKKLSAITEGILNSKKIPDLTSEIPIQEAKLKQLIKDKKDKVSYKHSYSSLTHPHKEELEEDILDENIVLNKEGEQEETTSLYDLSAKQVIGNYDSGKDTLIIPDGYPRGASMGSAIHEVFERLDFTNYEPNFEKAIVDRYKFWGFDLTKNDKYLKYTKDIVMSVLNADLPVILGSDFIEGKTFKLSELPNEDKKPEIEFNFNYPNEILKNYLNGFIDLLFKRGEVYSILDWKSDTLSDDFLSYSDSSELKKHVDEKYSIQRVLYSYCLIKWLNPYYQKSEEEIFKEHFGGIYYVFVRGCNKDTSNGIYAQTWNSWEDLEKEFFNIIKKDKGE